jgi:hypothetical protein
VSQVIKEQVEKAARRDLGLKLQSYEERLETARKLWEERNRFDPQRLQGLHQVWMGVLRVRCQVERRQDLFGPDETLRDYFSATAEATEKALIQKIDETFPAGTMLRSMNLKMVSQQFPNHATLLEHELLHLLSSSMLPDIYKQIGDEFATLPRTPVMECPQGIQARWEELTLNDRRDRVWLQALHFPSFLDRSGKLFAGDASAVGGLNGESYREMMVEKIRVVGQQSMHVVRVRVRHHLDELEQSYRTALESQNNLAPQPLVLPQ